MSVAFIIPLISKKNANDFDYSSGLLFQTLRSLKRQTYNQIKVYVVCNDRPSCDLMGYSWVESKIDVVRQGRPGSYRVDKELKVAVGISEALKHNPEYIMCIDADDLADPELASSLMSSGADLVALGSGWVANTGSREARISVNFFRMCGSAFAFRANLKGVPRDLDLLFELDHPVRKQKYWAISCHNQDPYETSRIENVSLRILRRPLMLYRVWNGSLSAPDRAGDSLRPIRVLKKTFWTVIYPIVNFIIKKRYKDLI